MSNTLLCPRSLLRPSSPHPTHVSKSNSKESQKVDSIHNKSASETASVMSHAGSHSDSKTVWSVNDSFLPRAKPPPPLRRIKHERNRSESITPPPSLTTSSEPSTSRQGFRQLSEPVPTAFRSPLSSLVMPVLVISNEQSNGTALTRSHTQMTTTSEVSSSTDTSLGSSKFGSKWKWEPPTSWAGPSRTASADDGGGLKPARRFLTHKKSAECILHGSSTQAPIGLSRARSLKKLWPLRVADDEEADGGGFGTWGRPSGVKVKIRCYEDGGWNERPVADVIPMLRELKTK